MYCNKCGEKINDEAVICVKCGCYTSNYYKTTARPATKSVNQANSNLKTIAKVFMIIACVISGFAIIPLAWTLPMTLNYCSKINNNEPVGVGFKVCTLLFVNTIAGILMLCDND